MAVEGHDGCLVRPLWLEVVLLLLRLLRLLCVWRLSIWLLPLLLLSRRLLPLLLLSVLLLSILLLTILLLTILLLAILLLRLLLPIWLLRHRSRGLHGAAEEGVCPSWVCVQRLGGLECCLCLFGDLA